MILLDWQNLVGKDIDRLVYPPRQEVPNYWMRRMAKNEESLS